jgi:ABC-type nickel/cobalt efflux system permease component RcnA
MARLLIVVSVVAPVLVGGVTLVLLASALAGSWLWGLVVVACFLIGLLLSLTFGVRWARLHPEQAEGFNGVLGRATAFHSEWEPKRRARDEAK